MMRDVLNTNHDRDVRASNWFLFPDLCTLVDTSLVVLEISSDSHKTSAHVSPSASHKDELLFVVAFRGHVRWAKPTAYCTPIEWEKWSSNIDKVIYYDMQSAVGFLSMIRI